MPADPDVLIASADEKHCRALGKILRDLSLSVVYERSVHRAVEALSQQPIGIVFCDESLLDGSYRDLLDHKGESGALQRPFRLIVTMRTGGWDEYLEAMKSGVFDAFRHPVHPTDVEVVVRRALLENARPPLADPSVPCKALESDIGPECHS